MLNIGINLESWIIIRNIARWKLRRELLDGIIPQKF